MAVRTASAILQEAHIEEVDGRYRVIWAGFWWGGCFVHYGDAQLCRDWCNDQSDEDREGWVAQNEAVR